MAIDTTNLRATNLAAHLRRPCHSLAVDQHAAELIEALVKERDHLRDADGMADGCLSMIYEALVRCGVEGMDATPPMMYNDAIISLCAQRESAAGVLEVHNALRERAGKAEAERDALAAALSAVKAANESFSTPGATDPDGQWEKAWALADAALAAKGTT